MKKSELKRGFMIVILISTLITIPRIIKFEQVEVWNLLMHFSYIFLLNFIYWWFAQFIISKDWGITKSSLLYLTTTGFFSIAYHFVITNFIFQFMLLNEDVPLFEEINLQNENIILFFRGTLFSGIIYFILFYFKLLFEQQDSMIEIEQLRKEKLEAQLNSLKQQISPHFLFNSLTTLRTIVEDENSKKYINKLANVYRYLLNLKQNDLVSLKEELEFTESYLYIIKERFEDAIVVENNIPKSIENGKLPPLALQLLIENAIKHNEMSISNPLKIVLNLYEDNKIVVSNNLQLKRNEMSTGRGLENIMTRYQILANETIEIKIIDEQFIVKIPILW